MKTYKVEIWWEETLHGWQHHDTNYIRSTGSAYAIAEALLALAKESPDASITKVHAEPGEDTL